MANSQPDSPSRKRGPAGSAQEQAQIPPSTERSEFDVAESIKKAQEHPVSEPPASGGSHPGPDR